MLSKRDIRQGHPPFLTLDIVLCMWCLELQQLFYERSQTKRKKSPYWGWQSGEMGKPISWSLDNVIGPLNLETTNYFSYLNLNYRFFIGLLLVYWRHFWIGFLYKPKLLETLPKPEVSKSNFRTWWSDQPSSLLYLLPNFVCDLLTFKTWHPHPPLPLLSSFPSPQLPTRPLLQTLSSLKSHCT